MYYDGTLVALVTLITNPALVGLFWGVVRYHGLDAREFLGLARFTLRNFLIGVLAIAALAAALYLVASLAKLDLVPTFQTDTFTSARRDGWLVPLLLAVVVVGPIGEEIMFRGFLYRGWVRPGFVVTPIIMLTLLWSAMHMQYDWFGISAGVSHRPRARLAALAQRLDRAHHRAAHAGQPGGHDRDRAQGRLGGGVNDGDLDTRL